MKLCTGIPITAYHTNIMLNCAALLLLEINYKQGHLWLVVGNPSVTDDVGICCRSLKTVVRRRGSVSLPVILLLIASRRMRRPSEREHFADDDPQPSRATTGHHLLQRILPPPFIWTTAFCPLI
ncbi:unnamed protein product [Macrosiphum euphorbiae]|uniref:Uncharacterized protein n=1 Tax=Macrosiphum euphorbiae TaxID=13131 RepID=A0AAV0WQL6_9HEMI|nr:unnamed protein product [Macrosiphum euphorbiae]